MKVFLIISAVIALIDVVAVGAIMKKFVKNKQNGRNC